MPLPKPHWWIAHTTVQTFMVAKQTFDARVLERHLLCGAAQSRDGVEIKLPVI